MLFTGKDLVSVLFYNHLSQAISHAILAEHEEACQRLLQGDFTFSREGSDVFLQITSKAELVNLRQITKLPLFIY